MDTGAGAIDRPDPTIVDFVENSRLMPRGMSARFERLPGGVSPDIWLVHADDTWASLTTSPATMTRSDLAFGPLAPPTVCGQLAFGLTLGWNRPVQPSIGGP